MKRFLIGTAFLAIMLVLPLAVTARAEVSINIAIPPPIMFSAPPMMVVIPETYVYVVPDLDEEIFFYNGWWWRLWDGRWYRSRHYRSGWGYYQRIPSFYQRIPSGWRNDYRERRWGGHQWDYQPIPQQQVQKNWRTWEKARHWEKQNTWGVRGLKPRPAAPQSAPAVQPRHQGTTQPARPQAPKAKAQPHEAVEQKQHRTQPPKGQQHYQPPAQPGKAQPRESARPQQQRETPHQAEPHQGKPEQGGGGKHDRK